MAYVVKKWSVTPSSISIEGRAEGLIAWFLNLLKIAPTVRFEVVGDGVLIEEGSLSGFACRELPTRNICSVYYGYTKPWKEAVILGLVLAPVTFGLSIIGAIIYYFLNKTLTLAFVETSGVVNAIAFKKSVIEGQNVDEKRVAEVVAVIRSKIG